MNAACPYYMSIGMTYEQFWHGDPDAFPMYREMHRIKTDRRNEELWLQGLYVYDALCCASPIFHDFAKRGTKATPYPNAPYPLSDKAKERDEEIKAKQQYEKNKARIQALRAAINSRFENKTKEGSEMNEHAD